MANNLLAGKKGIIFGALDEKSIAWKTGTSIGHRDAWAIGVTPDYVVGVWVGNADGEGRLNLVHPRLHLMAVDGLPRLRRPVLVELVRVLDKEDLIAVAFEVPSVIDADRERIPLAVFLEDRHHLLLRR